jgi:hypothetical protein
MEGVDCKTTNSPPKIPLSYEDNYNIWYAICQPELIFCRREKGRKVDKVELETKWSCAYHFTAQLISFNKQE